MPQDTSATTIPQTARRATATSSIRPGAASSRIPGGLEGKTRLCPGVAFRAFLIFEPQCPRRTRRKPPASSVLLFPIFLFSEQETRASFFASLSMAAFCTSLAAARKTRAMSLRAERCVIASGALCHCERSVVSLRAERCVIASGALCHCERSVVSLRAERCVIASGALCHCERSVVSLRAKRCVIASGAKQSRIAG